MSRSLADRRERVRRMVAKRPAITIEVTYEPCSCARNRLAELLLELLDERAKSGQR